MTNPMKQKILHQLERIVMEAKPSDFSSEEGEALDRFCGKLEPRTANGQQQSPTTPEKKH